jgi:2-polyprenyl-3-methyl-5-hydroxy-6-metoxy-1,4-benzoquinol methylase
MKIIKNFDDSTFYESDKFPYLLASALIKLSHRDILLADIGCGNGILLSEIHKFRSVYRNNNSDILYAVDILQKHLNNIHIPSVIKIICNGYNTPISNDGLDFVTCTQAIEHMDDIKLLHEIKRIMKNNAYCYLSTVVKKPYGIYIYRRNNKFVLSPDHIKEYKSLNEIIKLCESCGFTIIDTKLGIFKYSILDMIIRILIRTEVIKIDLKYYEKLWLLKWIRKINIPIVGFYKAELLLQLK